MREDSLAVIHDRFVRKRTAARRIEFQPGSKVPNIACDESLASCAKFDDRHTDLLHPSSDPG